MTICQTVKVVQRRRLSEHHQPWYVGIYEIRGLPQELLVKERYDEMPEESKIRKKTMVVLTIRFEIARIRSK